MRLRISCPSQHPLCASRWYATPRERTAPPSSPAQPRLAKLRALEARQLISKREAARVRAFENTRWHTRPHLDPQPSADTEADANAEADAAPPGAVTRTPSSGATVRAQRVQRAASAYVDALELGRRRQPRLSKAMRSTSGYDAQRYAQCGRVLVPREDAASGFALRVAKLFSLPFVCRYSAGSPVSLPAVLPHAPPELVVVGRSNVGKSSLLNALTGTRVVRTSARPGKTRTLSWFSLGAKKDATTLSAVRAFLVDVPGLGFAYASKEQREQWHALLLTYLRERLNTGAAPSPLRRVLVLVDARHALMPHELDLMRALDKLRVPYQVVLTKADLVAPALLARRMQEHAALLAQGFPHAVKEIHSVSQRSPRSLHALRCALYTMLVQETDEAARLAKQGPAARSKHKEKSE